MGWKTRTAVVCERCKAEGPVRDTGKLAEDAAIKAGWAKGQCFGMALHLCPVCVTKGLPEWWPDSTGTKFIWEDS